LLFFPIYVNPDTGALSLTKTKQHSCDVLPIKPSTGEEGTWRWGQAKVSKDIDKLIGKKVNRDGAEVWDIFQKDYVDDAEGEQRGTKAKTIWDEKEFNYQNGTNEIKALFDNKQVFDFPKPLVLIRRILELSSDERAIVLDFFAGSCTTAHGVMEQNNEDGGSRRFICVQLPEPCDESSIAFKAGFKNIAKIGYERVRRAGKKVREENPMFAGDLGFRVFKLASSNIRAWEPNRDDLPTTLHDSIEHLKTNRTEQDILFELLLKLGLDLTIPIEQKSIAGKAVHNIGAGTLLVCLAEKIASAEVEPLALGIAAWHKELAPAGETTVVFRDSAFADDVAKTNLTAILQQNGLENVRSL
jgi:adenine-specific DNA-methyltransferase